MEEGGSTFEVVFGTEDQLIEKLYALFKSRAREEIEKKGKFVAGLAGGRSPRRFYEYLKENFDLWDRCFFVPTDERYVPSDHPESNYRFLKESLGDKANLYRVKTELPLEEACRDYDRVLGEIGRLDFILLGLGADGHTASLFPERTCNPCGDWACTSLSPDGLYRISMRIRFINLSETIAFFVVGERKRRALQQLLRGENIPASKVKGGKIFTDIRI